MSQYYLYLDHQQLAPIIRMLQDVIDQAEEEMDSASLNHQLRTAVYKQFITSIYTLYNQHYKDIKLQEPQTLIYAPVQDNEQLQGFAQQQKQVNGGIQQEQEKLNRHANHKIQIEVQLIQWIIGCQKTIFDKKQIVQKYSQISNGPKKKLTLDQIMNLLQKYRLKNIIVRGKQGKQQIPKEDFDQSLSIIPKEEEFSNEASKLHSLEKLGHFLGGTSHKNFMNKTDSKMYSINVDNIGANGDQQIFQSDQENVVEKE